MQRSMATSRRSIGAIRPGCRRRGPPLHVQTWRPTTFYTERESPPASCQAAACEQAMPQLHACKLLLRWCPAVCVSSYSPLVPRPPRHNAAAVLRLSPSKGAALVSRGSCQCVDVVAHALQCTLARPGPCHRWVRLLGGLVCCFHAGLDTLPTDAPSVQAGVVSPHVPLLQRFLLPPPAAGRHRLLLARRAGRPLLLRPRLRPLRPHAAAVRLLWTPANHRANDGLAHCFSACWSCGLHADIHKALSALQIRSWSKAGVLRVQCERPTPFARLMAIY
jgi:hypothetical protein